jgi:hypothetical protein
MIKVDMDRLRDVLGDKETPARSSGEVVIDVPGCTCTPEEATRGDLCRPCLRYFGIEETD